MIATNKELLIAHLTELINQAGYNSGDKQETELDDNCITDWEADYRALEQDHKELISEYNELLECTEELIEPKSEEPTNVYFSVLGVPDLFKGTVLNGICTNRLGDSYDHYEVTVYQEDDITDIALLNNEILEAKLGAKFIAFVEVAEQPHLSFLGDNGKVYLYPQPTTMIDWK